jgi:hypothetical protein
MRIAARTPRRGDPTVQPPAMSVRGRRVHGPTHRAKAVPSGEACRQQHAWLRRRYAPERLDAHYPTYATSRAAPAGATQTPPDSARSIDEARAMYPRRQHHAIECWRRKATSGIHAGDCFIQLSYRESDDRRTRRNAREIECAKCGAHPRHRSLFSMCVRRRFFL